MLENKNLMMLITSFWSEKETFKMIPLTEDNPYVECIFNPDTNMLVVISKIKKEMFHMLQKLDPNGKVELIKGTKEAKYTRVTQESYSEYYIIEKNEIKAFIEMFAINKKSFNYDNYFSKPAPVEKVETKKVKSGSDFDVDKTPKSSKKLEALKD